MTIGILNSVAIAILALAILALAYVLHLLRWHR